jgi:hypothetical protein
MGRVFGLDQGNRNVRPVIEDVVGTLGFATGMQLAPDDDAALGEGDFLTNLRVQIPAGSGERRSDELGADVAFGEGLFHVYCWIAGNANRHLPRNS